ncbi:STAS domain-containing protein [Streptomyces sp. NPDC101118]|uniref:STAS domain-containing protein n=1 Tax=Streptomyces sp. NPDC101118 TaxID=3366109 RepID=UPI00381929C8
MNIAVSTRPDRIVVLVAGDLDVDTTSHVTDLTRAVELHGRVLTLDLSAVGFMDSSGLHMLLVLRRRALAEGGILELAGVPRQALRLLDLTGTRDLFTYADDHRQS